MSYVNLLLLFLYSRRKKIFIYIYIFSANKDTWQTFMDAERHLWGNEWRERGGKKQAEKYVKKYYNFRFETFCCVHSKKGLLNQPWNQRLPFSHIFSARLSSYWGKFVFYFTKKKCIFINCRSMISNNIFQ